MNPIYPVYIISKGRWATRHTSKALEIMKVPYRIVVEPQEFDEYAKVIDKKKILVLPFSNLGQGSIPARNWVWEHSISEGHKKHWILDDNIAGFMRGYNRDRIYVADGTIFYAAEKFTDRYTNVKLSGFQYTMFAPPAVQNKPYILNTRIYSCILISNDIPFRWRGRYNEDTDLSLRVLKKGDCTILFVSFLCKKLTTMVVKGGNTAELYKQDKTFDGRLEMARSLYLQHPDCVTITHKWNRFQHHVDYRMFRRNKLIQSPDYVKKNDVDNFGMELSAMEDWNWSK